MLRARPVREMQAPETSEIKPHRSNTRKSHDNTCSTLHSETERTTPVATARPNDATSLRPFRRRQSRGSCSEGSHVVGRTAKEGWGWLKTEHRVGPGYWIDRHRGGKMGYRLLSLKTGSHVGAVAQCLCEKGRGGPSRREEDTALGVERAEEEKRERRRRWRVGERDGSAQAQPVRVLPSNSPAEQPISGRLAGGAALDLDSGSEDFWRLRIPDGGPGAAASSNLAVCMHKLHM